MEARREEELSGPEGRGAGKRGRVGLREKWREGEMLRRSGLEGTERKETRKIRRGGGGEK